jgi:hypothetical protein
MSLEEDVTFPRLHGLRPDLGSQLTLLTREHEVLRDELSSIQAQLESGDDAGAHLAFEALARRLEKHEAREEELLAHVGEGPVVALTPTAESAPGPGRACALIAGSRSASGRPIQRELTTVQRESPPWRR